MRAESVPDALPRKGYFLPVRRFSYLMIPKVAIFWLLVTATWIRIKGRDRGACARQQPLILGMDLESEHWRMVWDRRRGCWLSSRQSN